MTETYQLLIDGAFTDAASGETFMLKIIFLIVGLLLTPVVPKFLQPRTFDNSIFG